MLLDSYISENIEKYGTGFKCIKDWFKSYPNLKYQVNNMQDFVQVTIERISKKIYDTVNDIVNKRMKKILKLLQTNKKTTIKALSNELNVSEITMKRDMKRLVEKGFLVRVGSVKSV